MLGLEPGIVKLLPHNPQWAQLFQQEKQRLQTAIAPHVLDIQHVGSTSIPGIPAKPIIDIAIAVTNFEQAAVCIQPVEQLGYTYKGEHGIPRRHYFSKGEPRTHHIHMNQIDSHAWQHHIRFRDYLRQHPQIAQEYAALKIQLAHQFPTDRNGYLNGKAPFIERILHLAQT